MPKIGFVSVFPKTDSFVLIAMPAGLCLDSIYMQTFFIVTSTGLLCDLLWSDPDKDVQGWGENDRGVSFTFGADVVNKFLNRHDLDLICRAHQVSVFCPLCRD